MPYLICGLGQAGGKVVDEMFAERTFSRIATPFAINSTAKDLMLLQNIPRAHWVGVSEDKGLIEGTVENFEGHVVGGFGKDPLRADAVMEKNHEKVVSFFTEYAWKHALRSPEALTKTAQADLRPEWEVVDDDAEDLEWSEEQESIPFALLVVGLGGGTGCGIAGRVAQAIRESSSVETTILVAGILPATHDQEQRAAGASRQAWNALFALDAMEPHVDGFILIDNEVLSHTGNPEAFFTEYNQFVANALVELFSAHLLEEIDVSRIEGSALPMVDIQDIRSAVSLQRHDGPRRPGYASLGWGAVMTRSAPSFVFGRRKYELDVAELAALTLRKQTLAGLDPSAAAKALGLLRVPMAMVRDPALFPDTTHVEAELAGCTSLDEVHFGITVTRRSTASLLTLLTYERADLVRLERLRLLAENYTTRRLAA